MFCSTIIPTVGRSSLSRAVQSVMDQVLKDDDFEIIVVNDSGRELPSADWQHSDCVQVINTNRHERSVARNTGAAMAKGRYLHFLDDDDWILPGAIENLRNLAKSTNAVWLYGSSQLVNRMDAPVIQLHHGLSGNLFVQAIAGEWIPLQASLIEADTFFQTGGFNPRLSGPEDIDLCRRIALKGDFAFTSEVVVCISMGVENSTTDYVRSAVDSRWAREEILDVAGAFTRMRLSANSSYWNGRIIRAYLTSTEWNVKHRRGFTAASRLGYCFAGLALTGRNIFSKRYWRAVLRSYESETFVREFRRENRPVQRREMPKVTIGNQIIPRGIGSTVFCSTIIPTVNRPTLGRAVQSVLSQTLKHDDFEVIVVNDSGRPLDEAEWQQSPRVRVIDTQRRERCVARNAGAAIAKGRYFHFLDDDDWLLPDALQTFWDLAQLSDAAWLYGGCRFVDESGNFLTLAHLGASGNVMAQVMSPQQWVQLQSSLIKAEAFFTVGGFHPALLVTQDIALCRQIVLYGEFAETVVPVACLSRGIGWRTTTDYARGLEYYRLGREINLSKPGAFSRMRASACSGFWNGRTVRIYLASTLWNLHCKRVFTATSRAVFGLASFVLAGTRLFSNDFWRGIVSKPVSNVSY